MTIRELTREQLEKVKINYYMQKQDEESGAGVSYGEMANIDNLVSDEEIFTEYEGTIFTKGDFE